MRSTAVLLVAFACSGVLALGEPPAPRDDASLATDTSTTPSPYVKEGSIGVATQPGCPEDATEFRPVNCWIGVRFMFLPKPKNLQGYGYQSVTTTGKKNKNAKGLFGHPSYTETVGRIAEVVGIAKGKYYGWDVTLKFEGGETTYVGNVFSGTDRADDASIEDLVPIADLEKARDLWNGKTVWVKGDHSYPPKLWTYNAETEEIVSFPVARCSKLTVTDVVAGWFTHTPIRLVLATADGRTGFDDVQLSGTNISKRLRGADYSFDRMFFSQDPHEIYSWPDEVWAAIEKGTVFIGMSADQARLSWGRPKDVNTTVVAGQKTEQWVYESGSYVYITKGKVSAIQN